jgi:hypothetical protein
MGGGRRYYFVWLHGLTSSAGLPLSEAKTLAKQGKQSVTAVSELGVRSRGLGQILVNSLRSGKITSVLVSNGNY